MSRSKNRKIADLISGTTFDDGVVAASEVTGLATVATSGSFNDLSNQPTPFDPSTLATVATSGAYSALSGTPTLGTASTQATGAFATAAQGTTADAALPKAGGAVTGNVTFGDNDKAIFGAGSDLQIFHDGSNSFIADSGAGDLIIRSDADLSIQNATGTESKAVFRTNGGSFLYYNGSKKFETTTSGIDVTGTVNADALTGIGSIDATTKNAISAAGVGGLTTLVAENVALGSGSTLSVSLGDYTRQIIWVWGIPQHNVNSTGRSMQAYITDASGTAITGIEYLCNIGTLSSGIGIFNYMSNKFFQTGDVNEPGQTHKELVAVFTVDHAYSTSIRTRYDARATVINTNNPTSTSSTTTRSQSGVMNITERNSSIMLLVQAGASFSSGLYYSSIGVN
tara:strand:+ start:1043 stop:2233 length:1191 start_codon:yes stop_codon:yes gene_type:complete